MMSPATAYKGATWAAVAAVVAAVAYFGFQMASDPLGAGAPEVIDPQRIPADLLAPTAAPDITGGDGQVFVWVAFDGDNELLVACPADVDAGKPPAQQVARLIGTLAGVESNSRGCVDNDIINSVPATLRVRSARLGTANTAVLDVDRQSLASLDSSRQKAMVIQLVFTATAVDGVDAVIITADGDNVSLPAEGSSVDPGQPVTRNDYPKTNDQHRQLEQFFAVFG